MKIGRITIMVFKDYMLGPDYGKPVKSFFIRAKHSLLRIHFFTWCLYIQYRKRRIYSKGKPVNIAEFRKLMQARGVDLSRATPVEISVNGIRPIRHIDTSG